MAIGKQCFPVENCTQHYSCGSQNEMICLAGWTGANCDTIIQGSVADCDMFDGKCSSTLNMSLSTKISHFQSFECKTYIGHRTDTHTCR